MITWGKILLGLVLIIGVVSTTGSFLPHAAAVPFCLLIYLRNGVSPREALKTNLFIASFSLVFFLFAVISGALEGRISVIPAIRTAATILVVYNIVFTISRWLGKPGWFAIVNALPWLRLRAYFVLMHRILTLMVRSVPVIIHHARARMELTVSGRLVLSRHYTISIITRELYMLEHLQAAAHLRLGGDIRLWSAGEPLRAPDVLIFIAGAGGILASAAARGWCGT